MHPLGIQLHSVREELQADREGTLRRLAAMGFQAVEPCDITNDPAGFRAITDELGLAISSAHVPALDSDRRGQLVAAAHILGVHTLVVPMIAPDEFADAGGVARTAQRLTEAADWAAGHDLQLAYHNHWWEFAALGDNDNDLGSNSNVNGDGQSAFDALVDQASPAVLFEIDVYWAATGGADVAMLLKRLGDRVPLLHVKDGPAVRGEPMTAVGSGRVPIEEILAAAPEAARIVELDRCATDLFTALEESVAYLRGVA